MKQIQQQFILEHFCSKNMAAYLLEISKAESQPQSGPELVYDFIEFLTGSADYSSLNCEKEGNQQ
jgi:hypothetical protein